MAARFPVGDLLRAAWARDDARRVPAMLARAIVTSSALALAAVGAMQLLPELFTHGDHPVRELWAASVAIALLLEGFVRLVREELGPNQLVTIAVGLTLIAFVRQMEGPTWDYRCYSAAGQVAAAGGDLYAWAHGGPTPGGTRYLYSPLLADVFALLGKISGRHLADDPVYVIWTATIYWSACAFVPLLLGALHGVYGLSWTNAAIAATLGALSTPMLRTIQYSQPNAIVADCLLGWLLLARTRPRCAIGLLSLAAILKTSPVLFFVLPLVERRWRQLAAGVAWCASLVALSMATMGVRPWLDFLRAAPLVHTFGFYRDNSFASALGASAHLLGFDAGRAAEVGGFLLAGCVLSIFAVRSRLRWSWVATMPEPNGALERQFPAVLLAMCLLSPLLWEHHWVWAMLPCAVVVNAAIASGGGMRSTIGTLLVFAVPTFDAFPLSYHRLLGVLLVMADAMPTSQPRAREQS